MMRMMPDGASVAYRRQGDGPGTVLVHGGFIDSSSWTGLMEVLGPNPYRRGSRPARARGQRSLHESLPAAG